MEDILFSLVIGFIPAYIAKYKGRDFIAWYIYGVLLFIIALIHSLLLKDQSKIQCSVCKEWTKRDKALCEYCHTVIDSYSRNFK